jgi:hypothetical protein
VNVITVTIRDVAGDKSTVNINFPVSVTEAQAQSWLDTFLPALDAIVDGVIDSAGWLRALTLPAGLKTTPGTQRNQVGALMTFDVANTNYAHSIRLPAVKESKLSGKALNINDAQVQAVRDALTTGVSGVTPVSRFGDDLVALTSGMVSYRRKG